MTFIQLIGPFIRGRNSRKIEYFCNPSIVFVKECNETIWQLVKEPDKHKKVTLAKTAASVTFLYGNKEVKIIFILVYNFGTAPQSRTPL
ncbi:hypothetical protein [Peribacillus frigoritolerans]|uniref:hypothetical protein n=1 Tax=Peribacillus TaxID=2675229 RepID=UPI00227FFD68|nr:hypothetical protein [Peribacillus frigoritolerans]MCY9140648.1 hypothetical protein [Peribacillus frigoritolerans]